MSDFAKDTNVPTNDVISRQAAIDALRYAQHRFTVADEAGGIGTVKWSEDVIYFAAAERVLTELPSTQPEQRWIPVTERLPDEYKRVLVSDVFGVYVGEFVDAEENWGGEHFINEHGMHSKSVKAWMPLPELYTERKTDDGE